MYYNDITNYFFAKKVILQRLVGGSRKVIFCQLILEPHSHCPLKIQLEGVWSVKKMDVKDKWDWMLQKKNIVV